MNTPLSLARQIVLLEPEALLWSSTGACQILGTNPESLCRIGPALWCAGSPLVAHRTGSAVSDYGAGVANQLVLALCPG